VGPTTQRRIAVTQRRIRVALADDSSSLRELLSLLLEDDGGFELVGAAADGAELLDLAIREHPELVLLDLTMPVLDGMTTLSRLRPLLPQARLVVFTGCDEPAARRQALALGADDYIDKSVGVLDLLARLRSGS